MSFIDFAGSAILHLLGFSLNEGKPIFRDILRSRLWRSVIRSIVKLVLIFAAILMAIFSPFEEWWSELTASTIFIGVLAWSLVNFIIVLKNNYKLPICIIQEKSFTDGILEFVNERWVVAGVGIKLYDSLRTGRGRFLRHFNQLPASEVVVRDYLSYLLKDVLFFAAIFVIYFLVMSIGLKTLLLQKFTNLSNLELYLFPFVQVIRYVSEKKFFVRYNIRC